MPKPMDRLNRKLWPVEIDPQFQGKPCLVVGGGPSLREFDITPYREVPTIAVNQSFEIAPWAQYLLFADHRWFMWNAMGVKNFRGHKVTVGSAAYSEELQIKRVCRVKDGGLCLDRTQVAGIDSGCLAVNLAYHLGASRIILAGFDSGFDKNGHSHYHMKHQAQANDMFYRDRYGPRLSGLCQRLRDVGVPVARCTPPGRPDIPYMPLPEALTADLPPVEGLITSFIP